MNNKKIRIGISVTLAVVLLVGTAYVTPLLKAWASKSYDEILAESNSIEAFSQSVAAADSSIREDADMDQNKVAEINANKALIPNLIASLQAEIAASSQESYEASVQQSIAQSVSESQSIAASVSESESIAASVSASESQSVSESESIAASESESASIAEAARITVDGFELMTTLTDDITSPTGFIRAHDDSTFTKTTEAFYSTNFNLFVYYCTKDEKSGYYVYDKLDDTMIPFISFKDSDGVVYVVITPESKNILPGNVKKETELNVTALSSGSGEAYVPGWTIENKNGTESDLIYLVNDSGEKAFYEFISSNGAISIQEWSDEEETSEEETTGTEAETETEAEKEKSKSGISGYIVWLIIIAVIIILLIAAIIVVYYMSKKQDEEEAEINLDDDPGFGLKKTVNSDYNPNSKSDPEPFDVDFEDAFPEEMGVKQTEETAKQPEKEPEKIIHSPEPPKEEKVKIDVDFEPEDLLSDPEPKQVPKKPVSGDDMIELDNFEEISMK